MGKSVIKHGECEYTLSETSQNLIENLAAHLAERNSGVITVNHLAPHLPVSLRLLRDALDAMVDGRAVLYDETSLFPEYHFSAFLEKDPKPGAPAPVKCICCGDELEKTGVVACDRCFEVCKKDLNALAERCGWPARAVYEHEILYLASNMEDPIYQAALAGRSNYTLRSMGKKLERLCLERYAAQQLDDGKGLVVYSFPDVKYPETSYRRNMALIRSYPAAEAEEMDNKVLKILIMLACLIVAIFLASFFLRVPFPIGVLLLLIIGPIWSWRIWRSRNKVIE